MLNVANWRQSFPCLAGMSEEVSAIMDQRARLVWIAEGGRLFDPEHPAQDLILPVSGTIRVQKQSDARCERAFMTACASEGCAFVKGCHLTFGARASEAIAETDVEVILVSRDAFDEMMVISEAFRAFVFASCSKRITDLFDVIEETMAARVDGMLAAKLVEQNEFADANLTRQALSVELGTSPEVVSQHLDEFQRRGWIALRGGSMELKDRAAILDLARTNSGSLTDASSLAGACANQTQ